jgi:hypothetical protein
MGGAALNRSIGHRYTSYGLLCQYFLWKNRRLPGTIQGAIRSIGCIGIDGRGDERWVKATRWVIRGSRLLSRVSVAFVAGKNCARLCETHQSGSPPFRVSCGFRIRRSPSTREAFKTVTNSVGCDRPLPTPRHYLVTSYSPGRVGPRKRGGSRGFERDVSRCIY